MKHSINVTNRHKYNLKYFEKLQDANPDGEIIRCNNYYLEKDSKPFFFNSAEFHYFRTPCEYWEEEILKLKASGLNMISSYVSWIMHEEKEGIFNFKDSLNIKLFIELCQKHDMYFCLRLGPYIHAEIINGGLPQWLMSKPIKVRSNDEEYLFYAKRYLDNLLSQVKGLFYNEGGPIVAIYLENELDECPEHLTFLKEYINNSGVTSPIYFFTGMPYENNWYEEAIPTGGAYPFPTWGSEMTAMSSTGNYLFTYTWKIVHEGFGSYSIANKCTYALTEIGSGIMTSPKIRPLVPPNAIPALSAVKIASGCNFINYYMYHGGINPQPNGDYYFGDEISPDMSYDFQAPIGEFGQMREMNKHLKVISLFLEKFGSDIAPMCVCLQDNNSEIVESNVTDLRYAARSDGNKGYLFINNYQDHLIPTDKLNLQFDVVLDNEIITFPKYKAVDILSEDYAILPFNMEICEIVIKYSTAQPITTVIQDNITYLIMATPFGNTYAEYSLDLNTIEKFEVDEKFSQTFENSIIVASNKGNNSIKVTSKNGDILIIKTISKDDALNVWKINFGENEKIIISDLQMTNNQDDLQFICDKSANYSFKIFPPTQQKLIFNDKNINSVLKDEFLDFNLFVDVPTAEGIQWDIISNDSAIVKVNSNILCGFKEVFLEIDYQGDIAKAFINDKLILDNFYHNEKWQIGLSRYLPELYTSDLNIKIYPKANDSNETNCEIKSVRVFGTIPITLSLANE